MIDYSVDGEGIATISWNVTDRPMNVMNAASIAAFDEAIRAAIADAAVKGVLIASSRPEFVVGADLDLLRTARTPEQAAAMTTPIGVMFRALEKSGKPFVAAINGSALGGGYEIALACHRRIAADNSKTQIGLPEVTLGLLPGAGGTQRLPRMIGIKSALPYLLEGRKATVQQALEAGLVDEVVPADRLLARAREWLLTDGPANIVKPWDAKNFKFPGGSPQAPGPTQLFFGITAAILNKTQGLYPAPEAILACVYDGCQVDIDNGLKIEQRQFAKLAVSSATKNMINTLFYAMGDANRLIDRPKGVPAAKLGKVAVLGAGMMGAGIAYVAAQAGLRVALLDTKQDVADNGKGYSVKLLDAQVAKGRLSVQARDEVLARIEPTTAYTTLADCDLVVEAVFEDRQIKAEVTRKAEAAMRPDAIFASNTSTLPISGLAKISMRPGNFVGLHFFSPVERMPLVEVIRGNETDQATVAYAMDFVKRIRKTPIVVNDCPAFFANRAFGMFAFEAMIMLKEGINPHLIENAGRTAGMPMPPLALVDEFSVELLYKAMQQRRSDDGAAYQPQPQDDVLIDMVEKFDRPGRKAGRGFYDYPPGGKKAIWSGFSEYYPRAIDQPDVEEVRKRLMYSQAVEAARCVAENIVSVRDADVGSLLGWGFPSALGGVVGLIDTVGPQPFVAECDRMANAYGPRFSVPSALRKIAAQNSRYHS